MHRRLTLQATPSFFLYSEKTELRRFVSKIKYHNLYKALQKLYEEGKVLNSDLSSLIGAVTAVRYDKKLFKNVNDMFPCVSGFAHETYTY